MKIQAQFWQVIFVKPSIFNDHWSTGIGILSIQEKS